METHALTHGDLSLKLEEALLIRGRSVRGGHRRVKHPQVHAELAAVMDQVVQPHLVEDRKARLVNQGLAAVHELP